ncbi:type II toxin-antitoxin system ParD family antitoxin [Zavarzinia sp. CC-PAN008]|uniref:type II toxin-antitoxin system ParD family antitoxin n=1 Tax=Zavarzinia sp. CC-PAN008 TaxID=3243332 RepID=UPI003F742BB5
MTIAVSLGPDLERFVKEQVASGQYSSVEDVVRAALVMMEDAASGDDLSAFGTLESLRARIIEAEADPRDYSSEEADRILADHREKRLGYSAT